LLYIYYSKYCRFLDINNKNKINVIDFIINRKENNNV